MTQNHHNSASHLKYRSDIDGLRAVAVLSVVGFHAFPSVIRGGFAGVDVFFVISGFLISTIIFQNLEHNKFSFWDFYLRRVRRLFPALLIVMIACFMFGWFALFADEFGQLGKHMAGGAAFVANLVLWSESGYFDKAAESKPLLHLWSLGIEEQFYIFWPFIFWFSWKRKSNALTIILIAAAISFCLNIVGIYRDNIATFYSPLTRFWELLCGSILAWFSLYGLTPAKSGDRRVGLLARLSDVSFFQKNGGLRWRSCASFLGLILIVGSFVYFDQNTAFPGFWALVPVSGAVMIVGAGSQAFVNRHILSNRVLVWFGLLSFPLYLWHWPLLAFPRIIVSSEPSLTMRVVAVISAVVCAWGTYRFVENPLRFGRFGNIKAAGLTAAMVVVGVAGYFTFAHDGFEFRSAIRNHVSNKNQLVRTPASDNLCLNSFGLKPNELRYCRFNDVGATETVAVIGDSHAHVAYPGIAEYLAGRGKNVVLLANSSCPPILGVPTGKNSVEKSACERRISKLLEIVSSQPSIKKVFYFTRGPVYVDGNEPATGAKPIAGIDTITWPQFIIGTQRTIDYLASNSKNVYLVTENPELNVEVESCTARPFRSFVHDCRPKTADVLARQRVYLDALGKLSNVTVINSLNLFCPEDKCLVFSDGSLLYADDDHLSVEGSRFQARHLLSEVL